MSYGDAQGRSQNEDREERSVDPEIRERELVEKESGQRADRDAAETGEEPVGDESVEDIDVPGPEGETTE